MTLNVLFAAPEHQWEEYRVPLLREMQARDLDVSLGLQFPPGDVDYIVYAPGQSSMDFAPFIRAKAVLSLWAGVESIVGNATLTQPLTRMVDHGLTQGMTEWVVGHTMRHHLGMDAHIKNPNRIWQKSTPPLAQNRRVTVLGLGALGLSAARALKRLGFPVTGWSRTPKAEHGIICLHGTDGLAQALSIADVCILLLPNTPATQNILNADSIALMPRGAFVINPGRGQLIDDSALLAALGSGQIAHATLDVFRIEPLPNDHPYWAHSSVTVTPHIAAETRPETCAEVIAENIRRSEAREPLLHLVDRNLGY